MLDQELKQKLQEIAYPIQSSTEGGELIVVELDKLVSFIQNQRTRAKEDLADFVMSPLDDSNMPR